MTIRNALKVGLKTFVNPRGWVDYDSLKYQNKIIYKNLKPLFSKPQPIRGETFDQAIQRLGLSEADIQATIKSYRRYSIFFVIIGLITFYYSFYLLFRHVSFASWLLGLGAAGLFFGQAFKYDFWVLQMHKRTLGLTFADWKRNILGHKGSS